MIIATGGHVDHGKTLLVKALTGIDTDLLPQEKVRGMSIDLGFAYHDIGNGSSLAFIDVPGHERFINNMLAGVSSIDFGLLVIAADDGPMPQTLEHLAIFHLLGVSRGAVVLTKKEKVSTDRLSEVTQLTKEVLKDTSMAKANIFSVSSTKGMGIDNLLAYLKLQAEQIESKRKGGNFRLAVDRRFLVKGAGIVVTGSVFSGKVSVGDLLIHSATDSVVKVRAIQSQNKETQHSVGGERSALNIVGRGLDLKNIRRGDWILEKNMNLPTSRLDAMLTVLRSEVKSLKHWTPGHLYLGSANVICRVAVLRNKEIQPGSNEFVQLVVEGDIYAVFGDHFIIRDISSKRTIAGGLIIDPFAKAHRRTSSERIMKLQSLSFQSSKRSLSELLINNPGGLDLGAFSAGRNLTRNEFKSIETELDIKLVVCRNITWGLLRTKWNSFIEKTVKRAQLWHRKFPNDAGIPIKDLISDLGLGVPNFVAMEIFQDCVRLGKLKSIRNLIYDFDHLSIPAFDKTSWNKVEKIFIVKRYHLPSMLELAKEVGLELKLLAVLLNRATKFGFLEKISEKRYILSTTVHELTSILEDIARVEGNGEVSVKHFCARVGIGRNLGIEILEFFDRKGITQRFNTGRIVKETAIRGSSNNRLI